MECSGSKENLRTIRPGIIPCDKGVLVLVALKGQNIPGLVLILSLTQGRTERIIIQ